MSSLHIDLETFSVLDLKKVGLYRYSENCEILLCAFAFGNAPVQIIDLALGDSFPDFFIHALFDDKILKTAYNAPFEIQVLSKYFGKPLDVSQWLCTMVLGLSLGLPAGLDDIGKALNLTTDSQKFASGKHLIKFFSSPRPKTSNNYLALFDSPDLQRNLPIHYSEKWTQFKEYCKQDVIAERAIFNRLSKLGIDSEFERKLWCLDQKINSNGVLIDSSLVDGAIAIDETIRNDALRQGESLTGGLNLNSNQQMLQWIEQQLGWKPSSLDKAARADLLTKELTPKVSQFLALKDLISKTSVKKYVAMKDTVCSDGRARGMFQFYGANRTGRWAGRLIQLQNLPQNHISNLDSARAFVKHNDLHALQLLFGNPSVVLSQLIRTAFIAAESHRFIVADFSAIEARVIAWLADEKWRMDVFANGGDIYCASASAMFKVPVEKNGVNKDLRAKGKIAELACGFGGGISALKAFGADKMGLSDSEMDSIIKKWRASSPNICNLWTEIENCAKSAIKHKSSTTCRKGISFALVDDFLFISLPSGRNLAYFKPAILVDSNGRERISYLGTLSSNNGWGTVYTWGGKLVENIVQAIARDCLALALLNLDAAGYKIVMHIHDEIVCEMPNGVGSLADIISIMCKPIHWADGLLLAADGYETSYYRKD